MTRYGTAIRARNPQRSGSKIHQVAVDEAFGQQSAGSILPPEAHARTLCGMRAHGFVVCAREEITEGRECRMCP